MSHRYQLHLNDEEMEAIVAGAECLHSMAYRFMENPPEKLKLAQCKINQALFLLGLYRRACMGDQ
ncbi:MAG: hypothetical protein ACREN8_13870 [Candidatus Dormibacteraceae bacterium]